MADNIIFSADSHVFEPVNLPEHYQPQDADILALHWLNADELQQAALPVRSSLVSHAISEYLQGVRLPLDALQPMVRMV